MPLAVELTVNVQPDAITPPETEHVLGRPAERISGRTGAGELWVIVTSVSAKLKPDPDTVTVPVLVVPVTGVSEITGPPVTVNVFHAMLPPPSSV
jgi:hypothetical protein